MSCSITGCIYLFLHIFILEWNYESSSSSSISSTISSHTIQQSQMQLRHSRPLLKQQQIKTITDNTTITPMTAPIMISLVSPFSVKTTVCASCNWKLQFLIEIEQKFDFCTLTRYKAEEKRAKSKTHRISGFGTILGSIHVILICFRSFSSKSENCKVQETNQNQSTHKKLHFSFFRFFFFLLKVKMNFLQIVWWLTPKLSWKKYCLWTTCE